MERQRKDGDGDGDGEAEPVVIGGMVLDIQATSSIPPHPRTTSPGKVSLSSHLYFFLYLFYWVFEVGNNLFRYIMYEEAWQGTLPSVCRNLELSLL